MQDRLPTKFISPVAAPVDTYVRPQEPYVAKPDMSTANSLQGVADALAKINPKLDQFFQQQQKDYVADREAYGYGLNKNRENWNAFLDRVKKEDPDKYKEYSADNPHVQRGFNKAFLESAVVRYNADLTSALSKNPNGIFDASDPTAINTWMTEHSAQWMEANGVNGVDRVMVQDVFVPKMMQYQNAASTTEARERRERYLEGLEQSVGQRASLLTHESVANLDWEDNAAVSAQSLGQQLTAIIDDAAAHGMRDFGKLNDQILNSVVAYAEQTGNIKVLSALSHVKTGKGFLADIGKHNAKIVQARFNIEKREQNELLFKQGQTRYAQGQTRFAQSQTNYANAQENFRRSTERYKYWKNVTQPWAKEQQKQTRENWKNQKEEHGRKQSVRAHEEHLATSILADPTKNWKDDKEFKQLASLDPSAAARMTAFQNAIIVGNQATNDDRNSLAILRRDMELEGAAFDNRRITDAFTSGLITQNTLMQLWDDHGRALRDRHDPFLGSADFKDLVSSLRKTISQNENGEEAGTSAWDAGKATRRLQRKARQWRKRNPDGNLDDFLDEMEDVADKLAVLNPELGASSVAAKGDLWRTKPVFTDLEDLRRAVDEYNRTKGTSGTIVGIAAMSDGGFDFQDFIQQQQKLLKER